MKANLSLFFLPLSSYLFAPISEMKTYFISGRARSDIVPIDTRLARRHQQQLTSSTPATSLLLPSITKTDVTVSDIKKNLDVLRKSLLITTTCMIVAARVGRDAGGTEVSL
jgi:hypothetical protein